MPLLAQTLLNSGQSRKVIGEFSDQSLADPQAMATLQQYLTQAYLVEGNLPLAKMAAARALQLAPESEGAVLASARTKLAGGFPDEALAALDELLQRSPKAFKALQLKAEVLLARGKVEQAEPLLARVLELDPGNYEARSLLVRLAFGRQQLDAAAKLIDGMPPAVGALRVMSAGPGESAVEFSMGAEEDIPEEFQAMFATIVGGFFDNLERAARADQFRFDLLD